MGGKKAALREVGARFFWLFWRFCGKIIKMISNVSNMDKGILKIERSEQYRTVKELLAHSEASPVYYTMLFLSSLIIASGLLLRNTAIVIGGMLVTPMLTPVLALGLGFAVGETALIKTKSFLIFKSFFVVVVGSVVLTFVFGSANESYIFDNSARAAILYFIIALSSGIAATFAWTRKEIAEILPGVAIAVSLVPPLSLIGIGLGSLNFELARANFFTFIFNFLGIFLGSLSVFSLLKFYKAGKKIQEESKLSAK